ncbi:hypothetical protein DNX69_10720 [Rhodopseudomonas palustris]|uniref:Uncharacterized protein n=1 Tax=Rhodopseudomonas palustris TaxID=1076 RepID=A0A323UHG9_RHOPL|nr:hypothetical protein [Rhodopseudomonas palustris]PZA12442.1 hypothetical protein DNX69_10720 [Rhodopseudomonas palustris]
MSRDLPEWCKPGVIFDETYGNTRDHIWYVRALVDHGAVCRRWRAEKKRWHYEFLEPEWFAAFADHLRPRPNITS